MGSHSVHVLHVRGDTPAFTPSKLKLVLDLATQEGCRAELTKVASSPILVLIGLKVFVHVTNIATTTPNHQTKSLRLLFYISTLCRN